MHDAYPEVSMYTTPPFYYRYAVMKLTVSNDITSLPNGNSRTPESTRDVYLCIWCSSKKNGYTQKEIGSLLTHGGIPQKKPHK